MTEKMNDVFKHCFGHICAPGVITMMTLQEVLNTYTSAMCKDLEDCGVITDEGKVKDYISEQYTILSSMKNSDADIIRM